MFPTKQILHNKILVTDDVGFHAFATATELIPNDGPVLFRGAAINTGYAYNTSTSTFTCPAQGLYFVYFNLNMMVEDFHGCDVDIMLNGERLAGVRTQQQLRYFNIYVYK